MDKTTEVVTIGKKATRVVYKFPNKKTKYIRYENKFQKLTDVLRDLRIHRGGTQEEEETQDQCMISHQDFGEVDNATKGTVNKKWKVCLHTNTDNENIQCYDIRQFIKWYAMKQRDPISGLAVDTAQRNKIKDKIDEIEKRKEGKTELLDWINKNNDNGIWDFQTFSGLVLEEYAWPLQVQFPLTNFLQNLKSYLLYNTLDLERNITNTFKTSFLKGISNSDSFNHRLKSCNFVKCYDEYYCTTTIQLGTFYWFVDVELTSDSSDLITKKYGYFRFVTKNTRNNILDILHQKFLFIDLDDEQSREKQFIELKKNPSFQTFSLPPSLEPRA